MSNETLILTPNTTVIENDGTFNTFIKKEGEKKDDEKKKPLTWQQKLPGEMMEMINRDGIPRWVESPEYLAKTTASYLITKVNKDGSNIYEEARKSNSLLKLYSACKYLWSLGLPISHENLAYILPFKNGRNNTTEYQIIISVAGYNRILSRIGAIKKPIVATLIYYSDSYSYKVIDGKEMIEFCPNINKQEKREITDLKTATDLVSRIFVNTKLANDEFFFTDVEMWEVAKRAGCSKTFTSKYEETKKNSPWFTWTKEMILKTAIKIIVNKLRGFLPPEQAEAIQNEEKQMTIVEEKENFSLC
jgi:recombinational DNA repair protein RecT